MWSKQFHWLFILYIDHDTLQHLKNQDKVSVRDAEWIEFLQQFSFCIK